MHAEDFRPGTTLLFCRTDDEGSIIPNWDDIVESQLKGHFEIGLTGAGRYLLTKVLGSGSMGCVFLAKDLHLDRPVALKVVSHHRSQIVNLDATLEREARLGANLSHAGIATVYDFGFNEDKSFTVFEFVEGETLRKLLRRRNKIPLEESLNIVSDLASALDYAHAGGVIHRDLKPENICFTKRGECKILDLGIARDIKSDIESGVYSGTPAYSSPEQAGCRLTDGKSDQYSLGLIAYEMLTGCRPFQHKKPLDLLRMHLEETPAPPSEIAPELLAHVDEAILQALSKDPQDRFSSCQDFVAALGKGTRVESNRFILPTPVEQRIGFYIAHVAEESILAKQICHALERESYSCWHYGRDAIPGVPLGAQSNIAIEKSQATILLISRQTLRSVDFEREISHTHSLGSPLLPLLIDISREEYEQLAPAWCYMLGASPIIEVRRPHPLEEIVARIVVAAKSLKIAESSTISAPAPSTGACVGQIWATDANQIDIDDLDRVLFRNQAIDDFIKSKHRHFISAAKGFGKTLLLTAKRQYLRRSKAPSRQTTKVVPEGRPYLDFMSELRSLSDRYQKPLSDISNTKRLWSTAIRISAISHQPAVIDPSDILEIEAFPSRVQRWLKGSPIQPTVVFKELTMLRISELNRLIDRTENFLDEKVRQIHGGMLFFVDKVDQAVRHLSRDAWIAVQAGLIEAAWEIMNANSHLKLFASIRQEAFTNYQSDVKSNLFGATTTLDYSEEELRALLNQLSSCYEGSKSFTEFLGLNVVRHGRRAVPEDSFQYVLRHTCGRPRDLVAVASAVSSVRSSLNEQRLREILQETTRAVVVSNIFDETRAFLSCLGDRESRLRFLSQLPSNILTKQDAIKICEDFNGLPHGSITHFGEDSEDIFHPFRDLFFAGLLGVIRFDPEQGVANQQFRQPNDSIPHDATDLPDSPFFLIHPALDTFIRAQRTRKPFLQFQHITVGENQIWESRYSTIYEIEKSLQQVEDPHFVESAHQLLRRFEAAFQSAADPFGRVGIEMSDTWKRMIERQNNDACCDAVLWMEKLLEEL